MNDTDFREKHNQSAQIRELKIKLDEANLRAASERFERELSDRRLSGWLAILKPIAVTFEQRGECLVCLVCDRCANSKIQGDYWHAPKCPFYEKEAKR